MYTKLMIIGGMAQIGCYNDSISEQLSLILYFISGYWVGVFDEIC